MPEATLLENYQPPIFTIPDVYLNVIIKQNTAIVESKLSFERQSAGYLTLNARDMKITDIKIDGVSITDYNHEDDKIILENVPDSFVFESKVAINPFENKSLEGFYKSGDILCTQNEARGFRRITPFLDRPDVLSKYEIRLEADEDTYPRLLANGNLVDQGKLDGNRHFALWQDPFPKPCYLVAMVAGNLEVSEDSFKTMNRRKVKLQIFTEKGKSRFTAHAMRSLKKSMKWDEQTFGLEYDLDLYMIVAVDSFNAGAMENKGLNIFNSAYILADRETATDDDFNQVEGVIAHEYFHNYTGNRVTCRDWFQLTLKEGLTVFRDQEFSADMTDRAVKRIGDAEIIRLYQFAEDRGPNSHPIRPRSYIEIDNFYTATVYNKGAEVIRMIQTIIGKKNFRRGIDLYFEKFDGQAVTTEDFVKVMADASGQNLEQFKLWYAQAGTPEIRVNSNYNYKEKTFSLSFDQQLPQTAYEGTTEPMMVPIKLGLVTKSGKNLEVNPKQVVLTKANETITYNNIDEEPVPSLLQNFSAPVKLFYEYSDEELSTLVSYDSDNFNRYDASRRLFTNKLMTMVEQIKEGNEPQIDGVVVKVYENLLQNSELDSLYLSKVISVPPINAIIDRMPIHDYQAANAARKLFYRKIAKSCENLLIQLYQKNHGKKYELNTRAVGERAAKNTALFFLSQIDEKYTDLIQTQFDSTDNMTDYIAAFLALQEANDTTRKIANASYHAKWKDNFLVMNKWFAVQAQRDSPQVLSEVKQLAQHELYDQTNPNMVRALLSTFASANKPNFHHPDGSAYEYVSDKIIEIDTFNSHISSSLAKAFSQYQFLDKNQASLMKRALNKIKEQKLSNGLYEILTRTLDSRND